jgi:hypothetical protein
MPPRKTRPQPIKPLAPEIDPFPKKTLPPDETGQLSLLRPPLGIVVTPGQRNRIDAPTGKTRRRVSTLPLFEGAPVQLTPAQEARQSRRRALWKARQKRHRAKLKMAFRAEVAQYTGLEEQNEAVRETFAALDQAQAHWSGERLLEYTRALGVLWGALTINRDLAARVFEQLDAQWLTPQRALVFEAARRIHERGFPVTRAGIERELKRSGIVLLHPLQWMDDVLKSPFFPEALDIQHIDRSAEIVKQA